MRNLTTPVALFVYRRPEKTKRVIERIQEVKPPRLLVVGDGPADASEEEQVAAVRRSIAEADLDCEISTTYASENLGLKERFATGFDWLFGEVDETIILEDDTLPHPSFFHFCDRLLDRFRNDDRIWEITGRNELGSYCQGEYSYLYSHYGGVWGWATWKSSYEEYDPEMSAWENSVVRDRVRDLFASSTQARYIETIFDKTYRGDIETWDYQWGLARYRNNAVSVVPETNLVENIGFDDSATNTTSNPFAETPVGEIDFPLSHPDFVGVDRSYDAKYHKQRNGYWRWYPIIHRIFG